MYLACRVLLFVALVTSAARSSAAQQPTAQQPSPQQTPAQQPPAQPQEKKPDQKPEEPQKYEETVVVSASKAEEKLINAPATMSVVTSHQIELAPTQNFAELLRSIPGVNVTQVSARDINLTSRGATHADPADRAAADAHHDPQGGVTLARRDGREGSIQINLEDACGHTDALRTCYSCRTFPTDTDDGRRRARPGHRFRENRFGSNWKTEPDSSAIYG